jgi:predicted MFS family arabinose efflux permease
MAMAVLAAPLVARRFGPIGTVVLTEVLSLPFLVAIPLATSVPGVATLMWVRAMLMNMSWPMFNEATMDQLPAHDKPLISGWMSVAWSACWVIGSVLGGRIMEYSYTLPYFIAAAFYAGGAVLTWLLLGGGRYLGPQSEREATADAVLDSSAS